MVVYKIYRQFFFVCFLFLQLYEGHHLCRLLQGDLSLCGFGNFLRSLLEDCCFSFLSLPGVQLKILLHFTTLRQNLQICLEHAFLIRDFRGSSLTFTSFSSSSSPCSRAELMESWLEWDDSFLSWWVTRCLQLPAIQEWLVRVTLQIKLKHVE